MKSLKSGWIIFAIYVLLLAVVLYWSSQENTICWDSFQVDEPLLMELCGITEEEYFSLDFNDQDCPQSGEAVRMVGGCEIDWQAFTWFGIFFTIAYWGVAGIYFGVRRLLRK